MYYEINISLKGKHLFATAKRSITTEKEYFKMLKIFKEKFLKLDGYEITGTKWEEIGYGMPTSIPIEE